MPLSPNDSGGSQSQPVTFTNRAADRIVKAVRRVEAGSRDQVPFVSPPGGGFSPKVFRVGSYSGAWPIDGDKVVTLRGSTATLSATNLFFDLPDLGRRSCAIAKDGTAWHLVQWQWNHTTEDVVVSASLEQDALIFTRRRVVVLGSDTASTVSITTTTCA